MERYFFMTGRAFKKKEIKLNQKKQSKTMKSHAKPIKEQYFSWFIEVNIVKASTLRMISVEEFSWSVYQIGTHEGQK